MYFDKLITTLKEVEKEAERIYQQVSGNTNAVKIMGNFKAGLFQATKSLTELEDYANEIKRRYINATREFERNMASLGFKPTSALNKPKENNGEETKKLKFDDNLL